MRNCFRLSAILVLLPLFSCSQAPSPPACRVAQPVDSHASAAVCLISANNKVLLIEHSWSDKLNLPGGEQNGDETLQCAAHRETWEQTGFNVEVGSLLGHTSSGMAIFHCTQQAGLASLPAQFAAPEWASDEVVSLHQVDLFQLTQDELLYPDDLVPFRDAFIIRNK